MSKAKTQNNEGAENPAAQASSVFTSVGMICIKQTVINRQEDQFKRLIFFTPQNDYSVSHGGKKFMLAVAIPVNGQSVEKQTELDARLLQPDHGDAVSIRVMQGFVGLVEAAVKQIVVRIYIEQTSDNDVKWKLCSITSPAVSNAA